jgi:hypothetical protein
LDSAQREFVLDRLLCFRRSDRYLANDIDDRLQSGRRLNLDLREGVLDRDRRILALRF